MISSSRSTLPRLWAGSLEFASAPEARRAHESARPAGARRLCRTALAGLLLAPFLMAACGGEDGTIRVHSIKFVGVKAVSPSRIESVLATRESSKLPWGKKRYFDRSKFDADLKRIQAFYADRGYPSAKITAFDVKLNARQDAVDVTLTIAEGDPVRVTAVQLVGFEAIPAEHLQTLQKRSPIQIGQPRDRQLIATAQEQAVNELRDHGFPYAKVSLQEAGGADSTQVALTIKAEPGTMAVFGPVEIAGNKSVGEEVIRRELAYAPGDLYRRSLVQDTQRRLYGMELFQFATVVPIDADQQPAEVSTRITVAEGKHQRVRFGVGYGTEEKARVDTEYHQLNFLGGARTAGVHARWSSLDRGLKFDFTQPYVFVPHFSLSAEAQRWYTDTPAYQSIVSGGKISLTHRAGARTSWSISMTSERDSSAIASDVLNDLTLRNNLIALGLDPRTGEQVGTISSAGVNFQHSTVDNLLDAHHGYQISIQADQAGKVLGGSFTYTALNADLRHYLALGDGIVFASRLQSGNIAPSGGGDSGVPFSKKYFLGGATSVRGWGRYELGPLSGSGLPIGGNSMLAFSGELRANLHDKLGGVLFFDGGNAWPDSGGIRLDDLRYAVGPGLRYQTPVGPFRFDFGYQLNPEPNLLVNGSPQTRRWRVHISIGQAF
jgi:outer membrane protein assembly complex protein YaeT